ncbi:MAG: plasmid segregation protein ParM domain-containing protein [Arsenophonus sp. NC-CH8-MAG3]
MYNYEIDSNRYFFNDGINNASETTTVNYQYSDEKVLSVHYALLNTDLTPSEIELYVTLPLCEFFNEQLQNNTKNIEGKSQFIKNNKVL